MIVEERAPMIKMITFITKIKITKIIIIENCNRQMIAEERAPMIKQPEVGATYDAFLNKPEVDKIIS